MKAFTYFAIQCFCWFALIILLVGVLVGAVKHASFGTTPEAVGRIPELQNEKQNTYVRPR